MFNKEALERKINNRCTKSDLFNRGIIQNIQADHNVAYKVNQLQKNQNQHLIREKIQSRPSRQDLVINGILDGQDYEKTQMVKKCISDHLINRPGPMDVYKHLVSTMNIQGDYSLDAHAQQFVPFQKTKNTLLNKCYNSNRIQMQSECVKYINKRADSSRGQPQSSKFKNITFHEFVPGKSGSNGYFVKSNNESKKINFVNHHYQQLIEQQAHFLQFELNMKQNLNAPNHPLIGNEKSNLSNSNSFSNIQEISDQENSFYNPPDSVLNDYNIELDNFAIDFTNSDMDLIDQMRDQHNNSEYKMNNNLNVTQRPMFITPYNTASHYFNDNSSDIISSGYGTSIHNSDSSNFEKQYFGFGLFNDCDSFNSVNEKIELFERLQSSNKKFIAQK